MAKVLKLPQLTHRDRMAEVQVGFGRVVPAVDPQRFTGALRFAQALAQLACHLALGLLVAIVGALHQPGHLGVNRKGGGVIYGMGHGLVLR